MMAGTNQHPLRRGEVDSLVELLQQIQAQGESSPRHPKIGVSIQDLHVYGLVPVSDYLHTVATAPLQAFEIVRSALRTKSKKRVEILRGIDGLVNSGEMLAVLGRPGSGCTTFLKVMAGKANGLHVAGGSSINYQGAARGDMQGEFRSECTYAAELDIHFPELNVEETLGFAVATRSSKQWYIETVKNVLLDIFGLSESSGTKVGNEIIPGLSGGEKKRLSIAEAMVGLPSIQCWDNSTRGMDSATALKIIRHFRALSTHRGTTTIVSLYQAAQQMLDAFDKVTVFYQGHQIFFGSWEDGLSYFHSLGYQRPPQMTTGDFFTALTNPNEVQHLVRNKAAQVPVTVEDFVLRWRESDERRRLLNDIGTFNRACLPRAEVVDRLRESRASERGSYIRRQSSPYNIPLARQIKLCVIRGLQRNRNNLALPISTVIGNTVIGVIVGSVFYNLDEMSESLNRRAILLFFVILLNSFMTGFEVLAVWAQRPIVEKQSIYAFYHPSAEAASAMLVEMPAKILACLFFNLVIYFMANLRRTAAAFFTYLLFCFTVLMTMSMFYRSIGSICRTLQGSMVPIGIAIVFFILYTGFVIPQDYMHPWFSWVRYLNPVAFAFESVMINEFHDRIFSCSQLIPSGPGYDTISDHSQTCASVGAMQGENFVNGTTYLQTVFGYSPERIWRNYWILLIIMLGLCVVHLISSEYILAKKPRGEVLQFLRGKTQSLAIPLDVESKAEQLPKKVNAVAKRNQGTRSVGGLEQPLGFYWDNICYDIKAEGGQKRLLADLSGWVRPGILTVLMGATGAGKTTLLDVLSQRASFGTISGNIFIDGQRRGPEFQQKTGYAMQQDIHLPTSTVRESLEFAALLRQPKHIPRADKLAYVDEVIEILEMQPFADAVVGVPGVGLNLEQRKRLTIGLEIVARPDFLLFLDEPTSGLDTQTAWEICVLLRRLADHGLAILCTMHQPSSLLLQTFDKILLIEKGGQTIYFGDVGTNCCSIVTYLESKGAKPFDSRENAAEWMMEVTNMETSSVNWFEEWKNSDEKIALEQEISRMNIVRGGLPGQPDESQEPQNEYAASTATQVWYLLVRTFTEYWRTPAFLWAKFLFSCGAAIAISFSCWKSPTSIQGLQTQLFAIFIFYTTLNSLMQQIVAQFLQRRALFEAREGRSKTFSWVAFLISAAVTEALCQIVLSVFTFTLFYYPIGMYVGISEPESSERAALMFLCFLAFLLFASTFSHLLAVGMEYPEAIVNIGSLLFYLILIFCGVLVPYSGLVRFWTFMYWLSPFTYLVRSMFAAGVANKPVICSKIELINIAVRGNATCGAYLDDFVRFAGGAIVNPESTSMCQYCKYANTNDVLGLFKIEYKDRWMNFGIVLLFIAFNVFAMFGIYWVARVPKKQQMTETYILRRVHR